MLRPIFHWKTYFYDVLLPALRRLPPERADATLRMIGRAGLAVPGRAASLRRSLADALGAAPPADDAVLRLAQNSARFLARDYLLEGLDPSAWSARFEVEGLAHLRSAIDSGRGAILLGSHFGAHVVGMHWLGRTVEAAGVPLRFVVQRPKHASRRLLAAFDDDDGRTPTRAECTLRRDLPTVECARRVLSARAALASGMLVYFSGDVPWSSRHARAGRFLGRSRTFQSVWAELAATTGAAVLPLFCRHRPDGRYRITIDPPFLVAPGSEPAAVSTFLSRLEREILSAPEDAVAHLTWPSYGTPSSWRAGSLSPLSSGDLARIP